ncbi:MAG: hypothetical protein IT184_06265 [Acidobacteria bacterium]|nr:hypothetical protein [Acidobacteriota bacterium]
MTDVRIGRLLAACLHQAITERLPDRLEFYEHWLTSEGLRDGTIGAAPMLAVIGFLRTEGAGYDQVMRRAGECAAAWTVSSLAPFRRRAIDWLPRPLRLRLALRLAASVVHTLDRTSRASVTVSGTRASLEVTASMFCDVRGVQPAPLCAFYLSLAVETLRQFAFDPVGARLDRCHAVQGSTCVVSLDLDRSAISETAAAA